MNRTDIKALIQNLKRHGFNQPIEKILGIVLAFIDTEGMPLQQCEIFDIVEIESKTGKSLNSVHLRQLVHEPGMAKDGDAFESNISLSFFPTPADRPD